MIFNISSVVSAMQYGSAASSTSLDRNPQDTSIVSIPAAFPVAPSTSNPRYTALLTGKPQILLQWRGALSDQAFSECPLSVPEYDQRPLCRKSLHNMHSLTVRLVGQYAEFHSPFFHCPEHLRNSRIRFYTVSTALVKYALIGGKCLVKPGQPLVSQCLQSLFYQHLCAFPTNSLHCSEVISGSFSSFIVSLTE